MHIYTKEKNTKKNIYTKRHIQKGKYKIKSYARNLLTSLVKVVILNNNKNLIKLAKQHKKIAVFVDCLAKNNLIGIGIYWQDM